MLMEHPALRKSNTHWQYVSGGMHTRICIQEGVQRTAAASQVNLTAGWCFLGNSVRQNLRRAGFAFFGIFNGTEFNPDFYQDIQAAVDKQKGAVLVCGVGGVLEPLGRGGRQSRLAQSQLIIAAVFTVAVVCDAANRIYILDIVASLGLMLLADAVGCNCI